MTLKTNILFIISFLFCSQAAFSEEVNENLKLITDRTLYISGESIHFTAFNTSNEELKALGWSTILYVELLSSNNDIVTREKYIFKAQGAASSLVIPEQVLTGNYYLRAYTKWMRNNPPSSFEKIALKIINPSTPKVNAKKGEPLACADTVLQFTTSRVKPGSETSIPIPQTDALACLATLVPEHAASGISSSTEKPSVTAQNLNYIPETRGLSISGLIRLKPQKLPMVYGRENLTILGESPQVYSTLTDSLGKFYFAIPDIWGEHEIFISVEEQDNVALEILPDNDFSTQFEPNVQNGFSLNNTEKALAKQLLINHELNQIYNTKQKKVGGVGLKSPKVYSKADRTLLISDYIELPSLFDYFFELIPEVKVKLKTKKMRMVNPYSESQIYAPLVLLDWVAITDMKKLFSIAPERIKRIEVINQPYINGNITYGGIVSFFTQKNDFAGINLPSTGRFYHFKGFYEPYQWQSASNYDFGNLKYVNRWEADAIPSSISFKAPNLKGTYQLNVIFVSQSKAIKTYTYKLVVE